MCSKSVMREEIMMKVLRKIYNKRKCVWFLSTMIALCLCFPFCIYFLLLSQLSVPMHVGGGWSHANSYSAVLSHAIIIAEICERRLISSCAHEHILLVAPAVATMLPLTIFDTHKKDAVLCRINTNCYWFPFKKFIAKINPL